LAQITVLLDKGVVRRLFESERRRLSTRPLSPEQRRCVASFNRLLEDRARIYVTEETFAVIHRIPSRSRSALAAEFLRLEKGKYLKRWARRLQGFGFSAEDARVLSYASFGLDRQAKQLGVEMVITADRKLVERFLQIAQRLYGDSTR
jgi:hypothetical protein